MWNRNDWWKLQKWSWRRRPRLHKVKSRYRLIPPINYFVSGQILGPTEEKSSENLSQNCEKLNEEKGHQIKLSLIKTEVGA